DLLNQLNMGIRGTADAETRRVLNQAIALLELGHAILDLRALNTQLPAGHLARIETERCVAVLAGYFSRPQPTAHARALTATREAGVELRALKAEAAPDGGEADVL